VETRVLIDFHAHSRYSLDSVVAPRTILQLAKEKGLNGVAITDHGTIRGGLEGLKINEDPDFVVIVGSEIEADEVDIIGLFLTQEIQSREAAEVISEIKEQAGLAVWAHPYREGKKLLPRELIPQIDLIEGFNAKTMESHNMLAQALARQYHKPVIGTSDAHGAAEIGNGATIVSCSRVKGIKAALIKGKTQPIGFKLSHDHLYDLRLPARQLV